MIAVLELTYLGLKYPASLHDNGRWVCPNNTLYLTLNTIYKPEFNTVYGSHGALEVDNVLKDFGGKVLWRRANDNVPSRIY